MPVVLFILITFFYSWTIFYFTDAVLVPKYALENKMALVSLTAYIGHSLGMLGPAIGAFVTQRFYLKNKLFKWRWGKKKHYLFAFVAMFLVWGVPGIVMHMINPEHFAWVFPKDYGSLVIIIGCCSVLFLSGLGEEIGWCGYLLSLLSEKIGKRKALIFSGAVRGLWHLPVVGGIYLYKLINHKLDFGTFIITIIVLTVMLIVTNIAFGIVFGTVWYKTESLPLMGWLHQCYDAVRDISFVIILNYSESFWNGIVTLITLIAAVILFVKGVSKKVSAGKTETLDC